MNIRVLYICRWWNDQQPFLLIFRVELDHLAYNDRIRGIFLLKIPSRLRKFQLILSMDVLIRVVSWRKGNNDDDVSQILHRIYRANLICNLRLVFAYIE